jgi:hypothetical protein
MGFLGPRANAELVPKLHVALHASHAALPMVTLKFSPCTNVTLTFDFDFGLDNPVHGGYGWGDLALQVGGVSDETVLHGYGFCVTLTSAWLHCKLLSRSLVREGTPKKKESNCQAKKIKIWSWAPKGTRHQAELADWPSVAILLELELESSSAPQCLGYNWTTLFLENIHTGPGPPGLRSQRWDSNIWLWVIRDSNLCVITLHITDMSSRQRGRPAWRRNKVIVTQKNLKSVHLPGRGLDTKTNWPTVRWSQYNLNLKYLYIYIYIYIDTPTVSRNLWST